MSLSHSQASLQGGLLPDIQGFSDSRGGVCIKGRLSTAQVHDVWVDDQASKSDLRNGHGTLHSATTQLQDNVLRGRQGFRADVFS